MNVILWLWELMPTAVGFAGRALPVLSGAVLVFAGLFAAAWAEDFLYIGLGTLILLAVMALLTHVFDIAPASFW